MLSPLEKAQRIREELQLNKPSVSYVEDNDLILHYITDTGWDEVTSIITVQLDNDFLVWYHNDFATLESFPVIPEFLIPVHRDIKLLYKRDTKLYKISKDKFFSNTFNLDVIEL